MAITGFEIVSVPVTNQQASRDFYQHVIGFDLVRDEPMGPSQRWIQLAPPGSSVTIALVTWFDEMPAGSLQGVMLNVTDIEAEYARLTAAGLALSPIEAQPWGRYSLFSDPDGNGWILRQPPS